MVRAGNRFAWLLATLALASALDVSAQRRYEVDPTFNGGHYFADRFAGPPTSTYQGRKLVLLPNGDTVVAGRVSYGTQSDPAGWLHLGLVRYDASGQRVAWSGPGSNPYFHFNQQYVIYPKDNPSIPATRYRDVLDIAHHDGFLYVLVESDYAPPARSIFVLVFRTDGTLVENHTVYGALAPDPRAAALAVLPGFAFAPARLLVIGTHTPAGSAVRKIFMARYGFTASGGLSANPMPGASPSGYKDLPVPSFGQCNSAPAPFQCHMTAVALAHALPFGDIYIGGSIQSLPNSTDWNYIVTRVDQNGVAKSDFGVGGQATVPINLNGLGATDLLVDLVAKPVTGSDGFTVDAELFLVGNAPVSLAANADTRIAVAKLTAGGALDAGFGIGGRVVVPDCAWPLDTCRATAAVLEGSRIMLVGHGYGSSNGDPGVLLGIDGRTGVLDHLGTCYYGTTGCSGIIMGHARLQDVAARPDGRLVVAGDVGMTNAGARQMFGTVGFRPRDIIFRNQFEVLN